MANLTTRIEFTETVSLDIGRSVLIVGVHTDENVRKYYEIYKPTDRIDCRNAYEDSRIAKTYWEMISQGATDISCVSIPDLDTDSFTLLLDSLDLYSFDILVIPELHSNNMHLVDLLSKYTINYALWGKGFINVISPPYRGLLNDSEYYDKLIAECPVINNPQYFIVPVGDVLYNELSKFEYVTDAVSTVAGILGNLYPSTNPAYKRMTGVKLTNEFNESQRDNLLDVGYAPLLNTITKGVCIQEAITVESHEYFHIAHTRIANVINKALVLTLNKYIGNMLAINNIYSTIDDVLEYYRVNGLFRDSKYTITQPARGELAVSLTIIPYDTVREINVSLRVKLTV